MIDLNDRYEINKNMQLTNFGEEVALLNPLSGKYYVLNEVGKDILSLINEATSIDDLVKQLYDMYEVSLEKCKMEALTFLEKMVAADILQKK